MKNTILSLFFCVLFYQIFAQTPHLTSETATFKHFGRGNYPYILYNNESTSEHSGLLYPKFQWRKASAENSPNAATFQMALNLSDFNLNTFLIDNEYTVFTYFDCKDNYAGIYSKYDTKTDEYTICKEIIAKEGGARNVETLTSFDLDSRNGTITYTASSEDRSTHALAMLVRDRKRNFRGLYLVVLNENGDLMWQKITKPDFPHPYFSLSSMDVSTKGEVTILFSSYNVNNDKEQLKTTESICLFTVNETNDEVANIRSPYEDIQSMRHKLFEADGKILIFGYYSRDVKKYASNLFTLNFDIESSSFDDFNQLNLRNSSLPEQSKTTFGMQKNQDIGIRSQVIQPLPNGVVALISEQYSRTYVVSSNGGAYYVYRFQNILIHYMDEDGEILETVVVEKGCTTTSVYSLTDFSNLFGSFSHFVDGNDIYFLYNDNIKNYDPKNITANRIWIANVSALKSERNLLCLTLAKVSEDYEVKKYLLDEFKNSKNYLLSHIHHNSETNEVVLLTSNYAALKTPVFSFRKLVY